MAPALPPVRRRNRWGRVAGGLSALLLVTSACSAPEVELPLGGPERTTSPAASPADTPPPAAPAESGDDGAALAIPDIVQEVAPSVVAIEVEASAAGRTVRGAGSGVIYAPDGIIVTNAHVVAEVSDVVVLLASGERLDAEVVAADPRSDLAVLRVDATDLPAAEFAEELPEVGELAIAMGNPLGLENSVTAGIVSAVERSLPVQAGTILTGLIQTDASISPGNSGGALVNGRGLVMAINVAKAGPRAGAEGVGFAVPATTVRNVVPQLLEDGRVEHPFIGIRGATLSPQAAERFSFDRDRGVIVAGVTPGGPAADAGLEAGDLIIGFAGEDVATLGDLLTELRAREPGDTVDVTIIRGGEERTIEVTIGELPAEGAG